MRYTMDACSLARYCCRFRNCPMLLTDAFRSVSLPANVASPYVALAGNEIQVYCQNESQVSAVNRNAWELAEQAQLVCGAKVIRVLLGVNGELKNRACYPVELPRTIQKGYLPGLEFERRKAVAEAQGHCLTLTKMQGHIPIDGNNLVLRFGDYSSNRQWLNTTLEQRLAAWPDGELRRYMADLEHYHELPHYSYHAFTATGRRRRFTVHSRLVTTPVNGRDTVCRLVEFLGYENA